MANKKLSIYAIIIASYTAISLILGSFSFGLIQIRVAELLLIMCLADKKYIMPVTLGCFVTNLIGVMSGTDVMTLDLLVGTFATFLSGILVYKFKEIKCFNKPVLSLLMPVIINGLFVGAEISVYLSVNLVLSILYVAIGEFISVTVLGLVLYEPIMKVIKKYTE